MTKLLQDFIFPKKCVFCGEALSVGAPIGICGGCTVKIPYFTGDFLFENNGASKSGTCDRIVCVMNYSGFVRRAVSGFKFHDHREYGYTFAALICEKLARTVDARAYDLAACVPLNRARLRERGYNQAAVLAKYAARYFGLPYARGLLVREGQALRQSTLRRGERQANVKGAFRLDIKKARKYNKNAISGARIILIDDIATSMATINACAAALKANGASEVTGAVLASPL